MNRELLFYSDFRLGYHNPEAEERALRLAERGWGVVYVEQLGIRNPGPRHLLMGLRAIARRAPDTARPYRLLSPRLLPPRRAPGVARINRRWLLQQLRGSLRDPQQAIVWLRFPTPELVDVLDGLAPRLVIYELADEHRDSPELTGRLRRLFDAAEARVLARAALVFATSPPIRDRLARLHPRVRLMPAAAVDVGRFAAAAKRRQPRPRTALFVGGMDFRFDERLVAAVAGLLPEWELRLAGPAERRVTRSLQGVPNVSLLGPVPAESVPDLVAGAAVCLLPYRTDERTDSRFPVKLVQYLAGGRPVVATGLNAVYEFADVVAVASTPEEFATAIESDGDADGEAARHMRRERALPHSWSARLDQIEAELEQALQDPRPTNSL